MSSLEKGVLFNYEWVDVCKCLTAKEFHKLFFAMAEFQKYGTTPPTFEGKAGIIATLIFPCLQKRVEASITGKEGAMKRWNSTPNSPTDTPPNSTPNSPPNNKLNLTKDKGNINNIPPIVPPLKEGENDIKNDIDIMFESFCQAYPRKVSKAYSQKVFKKLNPSKSLFEKIMNALEEHKKNPDWQKQDGQFIPHASTWLNQKRWEDELNTEIKVEQQPKFKKQGVHL